MSLTDISILICTRNRASQLKTTLHSLSIAIGNVAGTQVDVVMVDNGSTDDTQTVINEWSKGVPFPVQNIREHKPGLSVARNAGILNAKGNIIVFTDDDCRLNSDYLLVLNRYLTTDPQPVIRGGKVELGDPSDLPFTILLGDQTKWLQDPIAPLGFIIGANMVIPRKVIEQIGSFDERFGAGSVFKAAEETDFIYRAYRAGIPVAYVPDLVVQHFHGRKDKAAIAGLSEGYFVANGALYAKYFHDTFLLRHLVWDIKYYVRALASGGNTVLDGDLGITYRHLFVGIFKGMALYFWVWIRPRKSR